MKTGVSHNIKAPKLRKMTLNKIQSNLLTNDK